MVNAGEPVMPLKVTEVFAVVLKSQPEEEGDAGGKRTGRREGGAGCNGLQRLTAKDIGGEALDDEARVIGHSHCAGRAGTTS